MKICLVGRYNNSQILNGPEKFANRIFKELHNLYYDVSFFAYFHESKNILKKLFGKEIIDQQKGIFRYGILRLCSTLLKNQPDIIHIITEERFIIPIFFIKCMLKGKIISTIHGIVRLEIKKQLSFGSLKDIFLEKMLIKYSDAITLFSSSQLEVLNKYYKIDKRKVRIIFNGSDFCFYKIRKEFDFSCGLKIVFYEGSKEIYRGTDIIISFIEKIEAIPVELFILTNEDIVNQVYGKTKIHFVKLMEMQKLVEFLSSIHILLKAPVFESFSVITAECMANGMIVIVPEDIGCSRFIEHGVNGFIYNNWQSEKILELLNDIYYNQYALLKISHNASKIIDNLNWKNAAMQILKIYQENIL